MTRVVSRISPEVVAALLSAAVILAVVGVRPPSGPPPAPSGTIAPSLRPTASEPLSPLVRSALETVVVINARLAGSGSDLEQELARANPDASRVKVVLPQIAAQVAAVGQPVEVLVADPLTADLGADLAKAYGALGDMVRQALRESIQNRAAYLQAGAAGAILIKRLEPLTARAKALLAGRLESANPVPTASASPAPTRSSSASSAPSPRPTPSTAPSSAEGGLVVNGGFEAGLSPWVLQVVSPAAATLDQDRTGPGAGAAAARIQIAAGADARSGISLVQSGVPLRAGQSYTVRLLARAAEARDVRIRLAGKSGDAYVARIFPVGTTWTTISFTFDALVDDPAAEIGIDLGRSVATTWIDGVTLASGG
jgi:carbohydrate binding protein with CBM4/9 domain